MCLLFFFALSDKSGRHSQACGNEGNNYLFFFFEKCFVLLAGILCNYYYYFPGELEGSFFPFSSLLLLLYTVENSVHFNAGVKPQTGYFYSFLSPRGHLKDRSLA